MWFERLEPHLREARQPRAKSAALRPERELADGEGAEAAAVVVVLGPDEPAFGE